jgi:DNA-binding response OmpR family regulator
MQLSRPHILLADSDAKSHEVFRSFFERRGWDLEIATDASNLGQALETSVFDIVIADATMPGMSPSMLLGHVFRKRPGQALIVMGESASSENGFKLLRSGVTDVITKPVDFTWLERCVEQAISCRRQDEREKQTYAFVTCEQTEMQFSCKQLGEVQAISLPILRRLLDSQQITDTEALKIRLAVQEAVLNAVEHGNLELESRWKEEMHAGGIDKFSQIRRERLADPSFANRSVKLSSTFNGETLEISIRDEGRGFLNTQQASVPQAQNLSCSGRGMTLMTNAVDEVRFSLNGSEVTLVKYLTKQGS